jgi:hypothetical protein
MKGCQAEVLWSQPTPTLHHEVEMNAACHQSFTPFLLSSSPIPTCAPHVCPSPTSPLMTTSTYTQSGRPALPPRSRDSEKGGWSDPRSSRYTESDDADDSGYGSDNPRPSKSRRTEAAPSVGYVTLPPAYGDDESSSRRPTTESCE